jgi:hypothetical protein
MQGLSLVLNRTTSTVDHDAELKTSYTSSDFPSHVYVVVSLTKQIDVEKQSIRDRHDSKMFPCFTTFTFFIFKRFRSEIKLI